MRRSSHAFLFCAGCLWAAGCSTSSVPSDAATYDASEDASAADTSVPRRLQLGTGDGTFMPLADGDDIELVAGFQGGWHVETAIRLFGIDVEGATLRITARNAIGERLTMPLQRRLTLSRVEVEDDHLLRSGDQLVFDIRMPSAVTGSLCQVEAEIEEASGIRTQVSLMLRVVDNVE